MHRITGLSLRQRSVVLLATILIASLGLFGLTRLKTELIPDLELPYLTVITTYPGASPEVVDADVSLPIETAIRSLPGIVATQSTSSENFSVVAAEFEYGTDMKDREQEALSAVSSLSLPDGVGQPTVERIDFNQFPVVSLALTGADGDLATLRSIAVNRYVPALSSLDGVGRVEVTGGADDILLVALDTSRMAETGLTVEGIAGIIQANNLSIPAGSVQADGVTFPVRVGSSFQSVEDLAGLVVGFQQSEDGSAPTPVTLGEVAQIQITPGGSPGVARTNGQLSVAIDVYLSQGANTVEVASAVRDALDEINAEAQAAGENVDTAIIFDQSEFIQESIDGLVREASLGALFAVVVIFAFLLSVRSTLVTAISIPLSFLLTFIVLWSQGVTLNIMTLGALAVAVGRVVDDSIVVLESIYRHAQRGEDARTAAFTGTKEVGMAITASTITTVAVFLPLGFVGGLVGEVFRPFALTVSFSLLASLLVALTVVPVVASFLIRRDKLRPIGTRPSILQRAYEPILRWTLRRPWRTLGIAAAIFIASFGLTPFIGTSFLPTSGEKIASIVVEMPPGTSQDSTLARATELEQVIRDTAPVELIQTQIGGEGLQAAFLGSTNNRATIYAEFEKDVDLKETLAELRTKLSEAAPEAQITVSEMSSGFSSGNEIAVIVRGEDYAAVSQAAQELTERIAQVENLINVENDVVEAKPEIVVNVDPTAALSVGSTTAQIAGQVRQALAGTQAGQVTLDGVTYPVTLVLADAGSDVESLRQLPVGTTATRPLGEVATVTEGTGAVQVIRVDGDRAATITGTIVTDETGGVTREVQKIIDEYEAPEGVEVSLGGVAEDQSEAFASMGVAMLVAVALVYLVMVASFGSLTTPFVILFSLPLALIGVILALFLTGKSLGLPALIGLLMLIGIVVTNAIVLLEYVLDLRRHGLSLEEALVEGGKVRVRPILMTALATILALIPLALSQTSGAIIASDLAVVVIGGLLTSTLLTLIVVPVIFSRIAGWQERRAARAAERHSAEATGSESPAIAD